MERKKFVTNKTILMLIVSVILLATGLWAANAFSGRVDGKETIAKSTIHLAAESQQCITYQERQSGDYCFQFLAKTGSIVVYLSNQTVSYWPNGTADPIRPKYNGTSGQFSWSAFGDFSQPVTQYLIFLNPDGISKDVSYEVSRQWTYTNYIGLTAGIAAAAAGALLLGLALLQDKLRNFNKALENQIKPLEACLIVN